MVAEGGCRADHLELLCPLTEKARPCGPFHQDPDDRIHGYGSCLF